MSPLEQLAESLKHAKVLGILYVMQEEAGGRRCVPADASFGGRPGLAILGLAVLSLKGWRSGKSSLPFILAQAGILIPLLTSQSPRINNDMHV